MNSLSSQYQIKGLSRIVAKVTWKVEDEDKIEREANNGEEERLRNTKMSSVHKYDSYKSESSSLTLLT